jgi:adenosylcobinamide-GDP ribazoletransferase
MNLLRPLIIALQFLTRLPLRLAQPPTDAELGRSLLCYPLVGALLGSLLAGLALLLMPWLPPLALAVSLLLLWVMASGGLHLDGLADTADGWAGARGDPQRALAIMKQPTCGPFGVIAIVLVLLVKFAALASLASLPDAATRTPLALLLAILWGRTLLLPWFLTNAYVRPDGLGSAMHTYLPRRTAWCLTGLVALMLAASAMQWPAQAPLYLAAGAAALIVLLALRHSMQTLIGGITGDTAGALVEISEAAVLLAATLR